MGEEADRIVERMMFGYFPQRHKRHRRMEPTAEERRAYAEARHEEMLDDLIDELPGDEEPGQEKGE